MPHSAIAVANRFIEFAIAERRFLTNMQIQKLVFLAHGLFLATKGKPLIAENFEAWKWGPVVPEIYAAFASYGASLIREPAKCCSDSVEKDSDEDQVINLVWMEFGSMTGRELSELTHLPGSPWATTYKEGKKVFGDI